MKLYIQGSEKTELPIIQINIDISFVLGSTITASLQAPENLPISDAEERRQVDSAFYTYMQTIINVIEDYDFVELEHHRSNGRKSQSVYFLFCYETDFYVQKVSAVFTLRISNHELRLGPKDKTQEDANRRQERYFKQKAQGYKWLSDGLDDPDDEITVVPSYVTYNGVYHDNLKEIVRAVRSNLRQVIKLHPPNTDASEAT